MVDTLLNEILDDAHLSNGNTTWYLKQGMVGILLDVVINGSYLIGWGARQEGTSFVSDQWPPLLAPSNDTWLDVVLTGKSQNIGTCSKE
jgi:hypothetical protein